MMTILKLMDVHLLKEKKLMILSIAIVCTNEETNTFVKDLVECILIFGKVKRMNN